MIKTTGWYVLYTKSRHEKKIANTLSQKGISNFLPLNKVIKQWHDRRKLVEEPLFPCYLFVFLESNNDYYECLECSGAFTFVKSGKQIASVRDTQIAQLRTITDNVRDIEVTDHFIQPGENVVITNGPLTGVSGEVVAINNKSKIIVKIETLNRSLIISLPGEYVTAAGVFAPVRN